MYRHKTILLLLTFCILSHLLPAQEFKVKAALDTVAIPGFYKIPVLPELTAYTKADLSDLRIKDNNNKQVPFIIRQSLPIIPAGAFLEFPILKTTTDSLTTTIELACPVKTGNDHLSLIIANNAVERYISISGSNNRQQWFIIDEHIHLSSSGQDASGSFVQSVYFPFSRYPYYKIVINNALTDPLNISKAGIYTSKINSGTQHFRENPPVSFAQKDSSNGLSYITIYQKDAYLLDRVVMNLDGPKYYKRTAHIYYLTGKGIRNYIKSFEMNSGQLPVVSTGPVKAKSLLIEIENNDNPPLKVQAIKTEQSSKDVVAFLEKGKTYFILAGNESVKAPQYDLLQFRDSIPNQLTSLSYNNLQPTEVTVQRKEIFNWSNWLWPAIIITLLALGFLTYKLLADMKRSGI
jgi:hypothetical protein